MEFIYLILIGLVLGTLFAYLYEHLPLRKVVKKRGIVVRGYRLHHSLYGVLLIVATFFLPIHATAATILLSMGVGIMFQHYLASGSFDFVTKNKK